MNETSVNINKLSFSDYLIKEYGIKEDSVTIKKNKQFLHIFSSTKDLKLPTCDYPIEQLILLPYLFEKL